MKTFEILLWMIMFWSVFGFFLMGDLWIIPLITFFLVGIIILVLNVSRFKLKQKIFKEIK